MVEASGPQAREVGERVEESVRSSGDGDLEGSKVITRRGGWVAGHELHQQAGDGQRHEREAIQRETDGKDDDQVQQSVDGSGELHLEDARAG